MGFFLAENMLNATMLLCVLYAFTQPLCYEQDATQDQFLSGVQAAWIQSFPSSRLIGNQG